MYPLSPAATSVSHFVSDFSMNPKPTSKRGQEQNFGQGSAMAKPKPMSLVQAKANPRNLVSQASHGSSRWSARSDSNAVLSNPENSGESNDTNVCC